MSTAPRALADWDLVEAAGRGAYRFRVEFLRRWIHDKHSLDEAKRELEQVSARAVRTFETARKLHAAGDLVAAVDVYRRALAANPNHARAQLGLAQTLYEAGRLEAAAEAFEKAYRLDPESARDGLVAAQRDLGAMHENESRFDQAWPHYQRILDINPEDTTTRFRLRDCWRATAGAHLAAGRWDKAAEAYREALHYVPEDRYLREAVEKLEERHVEAEALHRRRQQLERAVLESQLEEERGRREGFQATAQRTVAAQAAMAAVAVGATAILVGAAGDTAALVWPPVAAAGLLGIYAGYSWARRRLG